MKIIYNKVIPFGRAFYAINLFGIIFAKGSCNMVVRQHEAIHTAQMKEMAYLFFYLAYVIEWLVRIIQYRGYVAGYRNISFEREAYNNQYDPSYLATRKHYSFINHLKNTQS